MEATQIPSLDFNGSHTGAIFAPDIRVETSLCFGFDEHDYGTFQASGEVFLEGAKVDGDLSFGTGHFRHSKTAFHPWETPIGPAIEASEVEVKHDLNLCRLPTARHGLFAGGLIADGGFGWINVDMKNGATLDLTNVTVPSLGDNAQSWPQPGKLLIDGLTYGNFGFSKDAFEPFAMVVVTTRVPSPAVSATRQGSARQW